MRTTKRRKPWPMIGMDGPRKRFTRERIEAAVETETVHKRECEAMLAKADLSPLASLRGSSVKVEADVEESKKPWRTLVSDGQERAGRFTRTQIRAAVLAVKARREAREARARMRSEAASGRAAPSVDRSRLDERPARRHAP